MNRSLSGRADLLRALVAEVPHLDATMAELLGYQEEPETGQALQVFAPELEPSESADTRTDIPYLPAPVPFWQLDAFQAVAPVDMPPLPQVTDPRPWRGRLTVTSGAPRLAPEQVVLTRLRQVSAIRREGHDIDIDAVVERLGRGRLLDQLPRRQHRAWGASICIIVDRARRLVPYWRDQDELIILLKELYPTNGVMIARIEDGDSHPVILWPKEQRGRSVSPVPGSMVLVLGDLGCLALQGEPLRYMWLQWGCHLREQGVAAVALVPCLASSLAVTP